MFISKIEKNINEYLNLALFRAVYGKTNKAFVLVLNYGNKKFRPTVSLKFCCCHNCKTPGINQS